MNIRYKQQTSFGRSTNFSNLNKVLIALAFLFVSANILYAQDTVKNTSIGLQAGFNAGVLDNGYGPSLSFHLGFRPEKVLQTEMSISFDSQKGTTFSQGDKYKSSALMLAAGIRINIRPQKNWNPSLYFMPGIMIGSFKSESINDPDQTGGSSLAAQLGISNTFHKKHVITIEYKSGDKFNGVCFKYGFLF